jgi:hypothetical protein
MHVSMMADFMTTGGNFLYSLRMAPPEEPLEQSFHTTGKQL